MLISNPMIPISLKCLQKQSQSVFKCKDLLPLKPETLWKIETGVVRSFTWDEEGRSVTLGFWGEGDVVGQPLSRMLPYQLECLTAVRVIDVRPEHDDLQQALLVHAWKSEALLKIIHQSSVLNRLLQLLEWLAGQFGQSIPQGTVLNLRLTHQDIADTIGATRVTVTRLLKQLEREGKIQRSRSNCSNSPQIVLFRNGSR